MRKIWWVIAAMPGGITEALAFQVYIGYIADLRAGYRRIQAGRQIAETLRGRVALQTGGHFLAGKRTQFQWVKNSIMENCQRVHTRVQPSAEFQTDPMVRIPGFRLE